MSSTRQRPSDCSAQRPPRKPPDQRAAIARFAARLLAVSAGYAVTVGSLWWGTAAPATAVVQGTATFDDLVAASAAMAAWALIGWVMLTTAVSAMATIPGQFGRASNWCADRIAPPSARHVARAVLGLAAVTVPLTVAVPAAAAPAAPHLVAHADPPSARCAPDGIRNTPLPEIGRPPVNPPDHRQVPEADPEPNPAAEPRTSATSRDQVVVEPGATLWGIAAHHLGPDATAGEVAQEWPRWFVGNREQIGDDPDAIHPGLRLFPPES